MNIELKKDLDENSITNGNYWLRCINLKGKYSNELFTKDEILNLKIITEKEEIMVRIELLDWFKQNRPAIFKSSISENDPNGLVQQLINILKDSEI